MNVQDLYQDSIKPLPAVERLHLAKLILYDIPEESLVDYSESWSDEDLTDFTQAGWQRVEEMEIKNAESG